MRNIVWFRRDLRIGDHPALISAMEGADEIVPVFILDKQQISEAGSKLLAYMSQSLRALDESLGNRLHIIEGDQIEVLKELIALYDVKEVHISTEYERYGAERDARVEAAGIPLVRTGSPYAVAPGRVVKPSDATPYKVYTPFYKAWCTHGWRAPAKLRKRSRRLSLQINTVHFLTFQFLQEQPSSKLVKPRLLSGLRNLLRMVSIVMTRTVILQVSMAHQR